MLKEDDIMGIFHKFYENARFAKSLNVTFIALIPKNSWALEVKDYRLISLVHGLKKWNKEVFGNLDNKKKLLLAQLQCLENKESMGAYKFPTSASYTSLQIVMHGTLQ